MVHIYLPLTHSLQHLHFTELLTKTVLSQSAKHSRQLRPCGTINPNHIHHRHTTTSATVAPNHPQERVHQFFPRLGLEALQRMAKRHPSMRRSIFTSWAVLWKSINTVMKMAKMGMLKMVVVPRAQKENKNEPIWNLPVGKILPSRLVAPIMVVTCRVRMRLPLLVHIRVYILRITQILCTSTRPLRALLGVEEVHLMMLMVRFSMQQRLSRPLYCMMLGILKARIRHRKLWCGTSILLMRPRLVFFYLHTLVSMLTMIFKLCSDWLKRSTIASKTVNAHTLSHPIFTQPSAPKKRLVNVSGFLIKTIMATSPGPRSKPP